LERQRPRCCDGSLVLLRVSDGDPPSAPELCPQCGKERGRVLLHEVIVQRVNGVPLFTSPPWARFIAPAEVAELMRQQQQGDQPDWDDAERKARRRQAAGEQPHYLHVPEERRP
jgi:hypothetical protein